VLEAAVVLELALGKYVEASIIAGLLAFNAVLGLLQEGRAGACAGGSGQRLAAGARAAFGRGGARRVRNSFVFSFPYSRWPAAREKRLGRSAQSAE
jgi:hypothetical protein